MWVRRAAIPAGMILFLLGLLYAGLPAKTQYVWGIDFGLDASIRVMMGFLFFGLGSFLLWTNKDSLTHESFFDNVHNESGEIKRILAERKRR